MTHPWRLTPVLQRVGKHWDVVKVASALGERALMRLGERSGAVIKDTATRRLYWLIEPHSADDWDDTPQVHVLGAASYVAIPPRITTGSTAVRWRIPPSAHPYLTPSNQLHEALLNAERTRVSAPCVFDRQWVDNPVRVLVSDRGTQDPSPSYAHAACAQRFGLQLLDDETDETDD